MKYSFHKKAKKIYYIATMCIFVLLISSSLKSEESQDSVRVKRLVLIETSPITGPTGCPQNDTWLLGIFNGTVPPGEEWAIRNSDEVMVYYSAGTKIITTKNHWHCHYWGEMEVNNNGSVVYWGRQFRYAVIYEYPEMPALQNIGPQLCE